MFFSLTFETFNHVPYTQRTYKLQDLNVHDSQGSLKNLSKGKSFEGYCITQTCICRNCVIFQNSFKCIQSEGQYRKGLLFISTVFLYAGCHTGCHADLFNKPGRDFVPHSTVRSSQQKYNNAFMIM